MIAPPPSETFFIEAADGWALQLQHIGAKGPSMGVVLLGHAMMVDRRSMDRPAGAGLGSFLAEQGWEVYLLDVRGHGGSGPSPRQGGSWGYDEIVRLDLPAAVDALRLRHPGAFLWLVGHSLCGHCSVAAAGTGAYRRPPDGHVFFSVNTWLPRLDPSRRRRLRRAALVIAFASLARARGFFPSRALRLGPADEAISYVRDLSRFWRSGTWGSRDGRHDYLASLLAVRGPILSVIGRGDELLAHHVGARAWARCFGVGRVEFWLVGRGVRGLDFDPDHMTLVTEPRSRPAWVAVARWMEEQARAATGSDARLDPAARDV